MSRMRTKPPFRADHVGSLLRPPHLIAAREQWMAGRLPAEDLRGIEDDCIRDAVAMQERVGLQSISDGELRRSSWRDLLFETADGFSTERYESNFTFTQFSGETNKGMPVPKVTGRLHRRAPLTCGQFSFLAPLTARTAKATLPSPSVSHFFRGDDMLAGSPYGDRRAYFADVACIYREEIDDLAARGCTYLQIDDVPSAVLCDPDNEALVRARGEDPQELLDDYVALHNAAVRDRPRHMTLAVHLCRGNMGHGQASGGYEPVAERLFRQVDADAYLLEYDTGRAGGFEPLRFLPNDRIAVLGLMSTKLPELEPVDVLRRRVDAAAQYVDLDRLCISPQCGFASSYGNTRFTLDQQERKLAHLVAVADEIWG
jgi:5-methyltetrahydropteroyltriglutamate--homocysteine methyltransferase